MFKENTPYYQCEQVYWRRVSRPVVSTWIFLGREVLAAGSKPEGTVGYVFAYWCPSSRPLATSVTRVFWELQTARETMLSYADFMRLIASYAPKQPQQCSEANSVGLDGIFSLVGDATTPESGEVHPDLFTDNKVYCEGSLYYGASLLFEPRSIVFQTHLCEGVARNVQGIRPKKSKCPLLFSNVFSRGLGLEKFGSPVLCVNAHRYDWQDWCAYASSREFDNRASGGENTAE